jgi:nitroreductase
MELRDALRTTGSIREFTGESVSDTLLHEILDDARFAPSGGNRQAWRVIVVKDPATRHAVAGAYLEAWHGYVAQLLVGVVPYSPLASDADRDAAAAQRDNAQARSQPDGFAETFAEVPTMMVILADLRVLAATDRDLERYQFVGGASIYPFVWSILLAAHDRGVGGVMTTVAIKNEPSLRDALGLPDHFAVASVMALGYPKVRHTKLTRRPVAEFTTLDRLDGDHFIV